MDLATVDHLLTTTRSVRRRLDFTRAVDPSIIERCIAIALQAPNGSNAQGWHFMVVTDAAKRKRLADLYRTAFELYRNAPPEVRQAIPETDRRFAQTQRIIESAGYLADHLHEAPALVVPCIDRRVEDAGVLAQASVYGSILPAVWSFMLALRARGFGSAWTTLHLMYERDAAAILGIPATVTQTALLPVAHFLGDDFKPARRLPAEQSTHWNTWGARR